ncbi:hypothetical protein OIU34_22260 [Pararhizobium sp. BT-229]|uniref:hypothetical protein n=1 Tax=Pararhizobium sp. BT-229 TaxID=2986923 RepID=UPI0021F70C54|nr:hypothetical protein [Pararhizobium sp. BT-229]MCV9964618.1 hypothetical protein [Pararhizobium sp. BT-229]
MTNTPDLNRRTFLSRRDVYSTMIGRERQLNLMFRPKYRVVERPGPERTVYAVEKKTFFAWRPEMTMWNEGIVETTKAAALAFITACLEDFDNARSMSVGEVHGFLRKRFKQRHDTVDRDSPTFLADEYAIRSALSHKKWNYKEMLGPERFLALRFPPRFRVKTLVEPAPGKRLGEFAVQKLYPGGIWMTVPTIHGGLFIESTRLDAEGIIATFLEEFEGARAMTETEVKELMWRWQHHEDEPRPAGMPAILLPHEV